MFEHPMSNSVVIATIFVIAFFCGVSIVLIKKYAKKYKEGK
ncbi:hypothetical protein [Campylobacter estrildidarum]|nr:hypothetical protein [Campylobacter estrildidarum]